MTIQKIYEHYKIPPNLQLHQLRVAQVAKLICDNFEEQVDTQSIVAACLLHDMGNILKFNFDVFPEFTQPEGKDYWETVKQEFKEKYGNDEHHATLEIAKDLHIEDHILELIDAIGFPNADKNVAQDNFGKKICGYSDMRVAPKGINSLLDRLSDARKRYVDIPNAKWTIESFLYHQNHWQEIEKQIFAKCRITPSYISEETVNPQIKDLKNFEILSG